MGSKIYLSSAASPATELEQPIYVNNISSLGNVNYQSPVQVNIIDTLGTPIAPVSVGKVSNTVTAEMNIPNPNGVALLRSTPNDGISSNTYDTGWRAQNGWFNYTPPTYPEKYAQLDETLGVNSFFRLKTPLRVNGVLSTERFVDLSGVQGWAALNNLNFAVLDKLTGLMYTRSNQVTATAYAGWQAGLTTAYNYSIVINGNTYSDWFMMGTAEANLFFGNRLGSGNFNDPISGLTIRAGVSTVYFAEMIFAGSDVMGYTSINTTRGHLAKINVNVSSPNVLWIHDAQNLISA